MYPAITIRPATLAWTAAAAIIAGSALVALLAVAYDGMDRFLWMHVCMVAVPLVLGGMWVLDAMGAGHVLGAVHRDDAEAPSGRALRAFAIAQGCRLLIIPLATALAIGIM